MKTLKKIKLHNIAQENLADREMNILRGGNNCNCGCDNGGPSSKSDVFDFNKGVWISFVLYMWMSWALCFG